jgi:hypothetical protein
VSDLEIFCPTPREITIRGEVLGVLPLTMKQIPSFSKAIEPAMLVLFGGDWKLAAQDHGDAMQKAISIALGKPLDWVGNLYANEFLALCELVLEVNLDFFGRQVQPVVARLNQQILALIQPDTAISSPGLLSAGTDRPN